MLENFMRVSLVGVEVNKTDASESFNAKGRLQVPGGEKHREPFPRHKPGQNSEIGWMEHVLAQLSRQSAVDVAHLL